MTTPKIGTNFIIMITMKMTRVILKDSRILGTTKRDGEEARVSAALTFLQVAARAAAAVGGEKFERSRGRELDEILQVQAASDMKSNLATSFKVRSSGSSHLRASDSMKPVYLNIAKGTTDLRVEFILPKYLL